MKRKTNDGATILTSEDCDIENLDIESLVDKQLERLAEGSLSRATPNANADDVIDLDREIILQVGVENKTVKQVLSFRIFDFKYTKVQDSCRIIISLKDSSGPVLTSLLSLVSTGNEITFLTIRSDTKVADFYPVHDRGVSILSIEEEFSKRAQRTLPHVVFFFEQT